MIDPISLAIIGKVVFAHHAAGAAAAHVATAHVAAGAAGHAKVAAYITGGVVAGAVMARVASILAEAVQGDLMSPEAAKETYNNISRLSSQDKEEAKNELEGWRKRWSR
jgi:hypothetical protein